jgi:hypothetical protein
MNADVEIRVANVSDAIAVPNAALRAPGDLASAAALLGLSEEWVNSQIENLDVADEPRQPRRGETQGRGNPPPAEDRFDAGGEYVVFKTRNDTVSLASVRTGLTDFDYSAVVSGLAPGDSVIILPTAGYLAEQAQRQEWIDRRAGNAVGGPVGGGGGGGGGGRGGANTGRGRGG